MLLNQSKILLTANIPRSTATMIPSWKITRTLQRRGIGSNHCLVCISSLFRWYIFSWTKATKCIRIKKFGFALAVALSYSEQILDDGVIPVTSSDVPVDALVSPEGVIPISAAALNRYHGTNSFTFVALRH